MNHYAILNGTEITGTMAADGPFSGGVQLPGPIDWSNKPSQNHTAHWVNGEVVWQDSRDLAEVKACKLHVLRDSREAALNSTFIWDGSTFDADQVSQTRLMGLYVDSQSAGFTTRAWRLTDNSWRVLNAADAAGVWGALTAHIDTQFIHFAAKEAEVNASATDTLAKVDAIAW